jgi:formamidopyrimidine-DNA glycosylase
MPELPEVETVVRYLKRIEGRVVADVSTSGAKFRIKPNPDFLEEACGAEIVYVIRKAKYIIIHLSNARSMIIHLGMTGRLLLLDQPQDEPAKHDHLTISLKGGDASRYCCLVFNDARRFGLYDLVETKKLDQYPLLANLGKEPLADDFTAEVLAGIIKGRFAPIKSTLMNANLIVGVGNIYASESLFRAKIHPLRSASSLSEQEIKLLFLKIREVLLDAIESGGSTLRDYVRSDGDIGYFQHSFNVYGKSEKPCISCGNQIQMVRIAGRSTFYCNSCQK